MATPATVRSHLAGLLNEEGALLIRLEAELQKETAILRGDDTGAIQQAGALRQECTAALARIAAEREAACRLLTRTATGADFPKLLAWCDEGEVLTRQWQDNLARARRCRELNERNGAIVSVKLNHVQSLLAALRGVQSQPDYGPTAARHHIVTSRELGAA
jgi:flagellar biosynthesis/type III secretory pathway chaperone